MSPDRIAYQWMTRGMIRTLGVVGLLLGSAMVWGGPDRFAAPGFATARLVPGGVFTWGISLAAAGSIILAGVIGGWGRRVVIAGLSLEFFWFLFFAIGLALSTVRDPHVAVTGPFAYGGMAVLCLIGAVGGQDLRR